MKLLFLNGPNLNMLGTREPDKYGVQTLAEIEKMIKNEAKNIEIKFFQTNIESYPK